MVLLYLESIGNPRKFSRIARRVSRRKPVVAVKSGRTTQGVPMGHAVRSMPAPQAAVDAMFRQAGVIQVDTLDEMFDVAQLSPTSRCRAAAGSRSSATPTRSACSPPTPPRRSGSRSREPVALGADATAEDFEEALDAAIDDPDVDAVVAVYIPPLNTTGEEVANVLAAVGEQSDKPMVSTFLGREGVPELLRVPDVAGGTAGRGSVPSYPAVEAAVRALARVVEYAAWRAQARRASWSPPERRHAAGAPAGRTQVLLDGRRTAATSPSTSCARCSAATASTCGTGSRSARRDEAVAAGEELGWDVVLKATAEHLRQRPDLAHVWRNIDTEDEMRDAWDELQRARSTTPATAGFVVQRVAAAGRPGRDRRHRGPAVRPGGVLRRLRCRHRAARRPGLPHPAAAPRRRRRRWSARSRPRRCCSATAGSEQVDVDARRGPAAAAWPSSRTTCRRSLRSTSNLVLVGAARARPC